MSIDWTHAVSLARLPTQGERFALEPDAEARAALAQTLGLVALPQLTAHLTLRPWMDGVHLRGRFEASVVQLCGVSLEPFTQSVGGEIDVRLVPEGSPNAPEPSETLDLDPLADDPPEMFEGDHLDLARYVFEHLALEIDPFPRRPDAVFEPPEPPSNISPFAALAALKPGPSRE